MMRANGGFTLIELILVTVIIGILAGMLTLNFAGRQTEARQRAAKGDLATLESAIELYALDHNDKYPQQLTDLMNDPKHEYLRDWKPDPWKNPYQYVYPGKKHPKSYDVFSMGPDGQAGTPDDIYPDTDLDAEAPTNQ